MTTRDTRKCFSIVFTTMAPSSMHFYAIYYKVSKHSHIPHLLQWKCFSVVKQVSFSLQWWFVVIHSASYYSALHTGRRLPQLQSSD